MSSLPRRRIGLLTYGLNRPLSGVTRVALELGRALSRVEELDVVYLTTYKRGPFRAQNGSTSWRLPGCERLPALMVLGGPLIAVAARRLALDAVHDPVGICPFTLGRWAGRFKTGVTVHDAIAFRRPEGYPWLNNFLHRRYVAANLRNVDVVVTPSQHAAGDLRKFLAIPPGSPRVVPHGVDARFRPIPPEEARDVALRYGLDGPFVLSVGSQQSRKNLGRLVEAFARARRVLPDLRLAIVGPALWRSPGLSQQVKALGIADAVARLGYVSDDDLPALYSAARLFAFPSLDEGFGLPVLEALACGTTVVCSNTTSLPEVAGDAALQVDPRSVQDLAEAIHRAVSDEDLRRTLRRRGLERARDYSWDHAARKLVAVYRDVFGDRLP